MDASDRQRLEAYVRSQNYFRGVAEEVAEEMLVAFIRRVLPWLMDQIYEAVQTAWGWISRQIGW
jgi:hypothetical protein